MAWIALSIKTTAATDALSDALLELGALSVDIHDAAAGTEWEQPLFGEPGEPVDKVWPAAEVTALFNADAEIAMIVPAAAQRAGLASPPDYHVTQVAEQDWVRLTQAQFGPVRISQRLWVIPTWHQAPDPAAINLTLDPGLAFGTGSHPTTRLCLAWLDETLRGGEDVLDYGCGSGILAIAALKLGARRVLGIDIDPQAVAASRENAARNQCTPAQAQFQTAQAEPAAPAWADMVVANILANPLIVLAPVLARAARPGARIALSGILEAQAEAVGAAYRQWFELSVAAAQEGWILLTGTKK